MALGILFREKDGKKLPTRYFSGKQEKAVAAAVNGKQTVNSGATMFGGGGDVTTSLFTIECKTKTSSSESISIKKTWFEKTKAEATSDGRPYSALVFSFGPGEENHYIVDEYLFQELLEYLKIKHNTK